MPETIPLPDPTVAVEVVPLIHVPPVVMLARVVAEPEQTLMVPVSAAGSALTVIVWVVEQPPGSMYETVVVPAVVPVTTPVVEPMLAVPALLLVQVPPAVALVSEITEPAHKPKPPVGPVIVAGTALTVTVAVVVHAPAVV